MFQVQKLPDLARGIAERLDAPEVEGIEAAPPDAEVILDVSQDPPVLCRRINGEWIKICTRGGVHGRVE